MKGSDDIPDHEEERLSLKMLQKLPKARSIYDRRDSEGTQMISEIFVPLSFQ